MITVREIRESMGLTQVEFAGRVGVTSRTVIRWEAGISKPLSAIARVIEGLGVIPGLLAIASDAPEVSAEPAVAWAEAEMARLVVGKPLKGAGIFRLEREGGSPIRGRS